MVTKASFDPFANSTDLLTVSDGRGELVFHNDPLAVLVRGELRLHGDHEGLARVQAAREALELIEAAIRSKLQRS